MVSKATCKWKISLGIGLRIPFEGACSIEPNVDQQKINVFREYLFVSKICFSFHLKYICTPHKIFLQITSCWLMVRYIKYYDILFFWCRHNRFCIISRFPTRYVILNGMCFRNSPKNYIRFKLALGYLITHYARLFVCNVIVIYVQHSHYSDMNLQEESVKYFYANI